MAHARDLGTPTNVLARLDVPFVGQRLAIGNAAGELSTESRPVLSVGSR